MKAPDLLRGVTVDRLLKPSTFRGVTLAGNNDKDEKKAQKLYDHSDQVDVLDYFVSHNWRASGLAKRLALHIRLNGSLAAVLSVVVAAGLAILRRQDVIPAGGGYRGEPRANRPPRKILLAVRIALILCSWLLI